MKTINEIAAIKRATSESARDMSALIRGFLDTYQGEPLATSRLYMKLGASVEEFKPLANHAYMARMTGSLDGYYTQAEPRGKSNFGHGLITWHARKVEAITGDAMRDKMLAALDPDARPAMLEYFAQQDAAMLDVAQAQQLKQNAPDQDEEWLKGD